MFHLFQHQKGRLKGKYDFAFVKNGKYICGSNQGYENKSGVFKALRSLIAFMGNQRMVFQDDCDNSSIVCGLYLQGKPTLVLQKPKKKYIP
jgi:uncharacterized protein YegP (UPF0339 family)